MATNIFDTRHVMNQVPKMSNRFLLKADATAIKDIIDGNASQTNTYSVSKIKRLNELALGDQQVFGENGTAGKNTSTILDLSLLSCTIPAFEFESAEISRFNDSVKHITKFSASNDMSAVYYDYINGSSAAIMLAWQSMVGFKLTGSIGYKKKYTCDMDLYVYGPNRSSHPIYESATIDRTANMSAEAKQSKEKTTDSAEYELLMHFKIFNAYPRSVDLGDFSYDSAEVRKVTVQFGYDMIVPIKNKMRDTTSALSITNTGLEANCQITDANRNTLLTAENALETIFVKSKNTYQG